MASGLRAWLKSRIPERYRLLRYAWQERLRYYPELGLSLGRRLTCPFCGWTFRRMRPAGFDYQILRDKQVVGASRHPDDVCPRCLSNARERLVYLYLLQHTEVFRKRLRVLHIAPEPHLRQALRRLRDIDYVSGDLVEDRVDVRLDVMALPFPDVSFDFVICNHVLEHVADDRVAMRELRRVLRLDGTALLQVPIGLALEQTLEDRTAVTEVDRIAAFGQGDHVRLYAARDYVSRLEAAGFRVHPRGVVDCLGGNTVARYALIREETIFACRRVGDSRGAAMAAGRQARRLSERS